MFLRLRLAVCFSVGYITRKTILILTIKTGGRQRRTTTTMRTKKIYVIMGTWSNETLKKEYCRPIAATTDKKTAKEKIEKLEKTIPKIKYFLEEIKLLTTEE